ncbi:PTS system mannose/fructose/sorbose family transporter subunit IID [Romboutsia ilealis]|uniref:PTS system mannose/fructose/sorbose family transporter subunit IID n=1 Tax=Romboutsia faecis TaxID=2764597 RepID=A0ABR7JQ94_9FIRM|nr:PTS system mannose/fructose/sorbose family transporter subunit IID [Romboutsia faecis]MBC5996952.1 PTS system mannose/fructose/sorbose family transporter subunit IID [Romboutsia faecis]MRN25308.1 PTS system mannose/fructose/sorbose family transporter subunit IID [Romboutsia ilealis]
MASKAKEYYVDKQEAPKLSNKILNKMVWRSLFLQASFNYERMQACGWLYGILPGLQEIHKNKEDLSTSMTHNLEFFNTHPFLVTFVMGIVLSLEQKKTDVQTIRALRVAAMGPLGGIGDAIFWFTLTPIAAGIGANLALQGSILGPIIFLLLFNVVQFALRYWLMHWSYKVGMDGIQAMTKFAKQFTRSATILGLIVVGALIASYVGVNVALEIPIGETSVVVQEVLDSIMPCLLPLCLTFMMYSLVKKNVSPLLNIGLLVLIGLVGGYFGIFV